MSDFERKHMEALEALRKASEDGNKELEEKLNKVLDEQEEKNQKLVKEIADEKKVREEMEEKYSKLEADLKRGNLGGEEKEAKKAEVKAFEQYMRKHSNLLEAEEIKYLRTDVDSEGGYLVPEVMDNEIIKKITEISNVRSIARVRPMSSKSLSMPARTTLVSAGMVGEGQQDSLSNSNYGQEKLYAKKAEVTVASTIEELEDTGFDVASLIMQDVGEEFARLEGAQFVNGSGAGNNCEGFMTNSDIAEINSGSASNITFDSIIDVTGELKTGYNPVYGMNRKTIAEIRKLKDGNGQYLWQSGNIAAGIPNSINGYSYVEMPDMPDIGAGTFPIIFGDFARGYTIGDRKGLTMVRDEVTQKRNGKVEFTFYKRFAGMVTLAEAFVKIKVAS